MVNDWKGGDVNFGAHRGPRQRALRATAHAVLLRVPMRPRTAVPAPSAAQTCELNVRSTQLVHWICLSRTLLAKLLPMLLAGAAWVPSAAPTCCRNRCNSSQVARQVPPTAHR